MHKLVLALVASSALTTASHAADKPELAPAPAWVKPYPVPTDQAKPDDAPFRILLSDQQISLERERQTVYTEIAIKIQTPQGLAAGNISFPWRPDTDTLTVHKLVVHRGDRIIDVLASGQTFTVLRREQNLESATLDGVLTATIQPEGLQVGDILDFAASITSSDPVMKGHVEQTAGAWNGFAVTRAHVRVQWPTTLPVRLSGIGGLPAIKPVKAGRSSSIEFALDNVQPTQPPKGAPVRYRLGRRIDITDFGSWAELAALMAPLYTKAAVLPAQSPLRAELDRIETSSPDPKVRAEAALALVQDRVRYVALAMGAGGYVPADANLSWSRRYGDCKGKTALLLALLHALGVQAVPVAVDALGGDGLDTRLPMVGMFNHVLVRATIGGTDYWLDGTRTGDTGLDGLRTPNFGWGLPLVANQSALVRIVPAPLDRPTHETRLRIDATAGLTVPAPVKVETIYRETDAELTASLAITPTTAEGFVSRGNALLNHGKLDEAIKDFDQAHALDAKNAYALADRGLARVWKGDYGAASVDLDAAAAIEPRNAVVFRARGLAAERKGDVKAALAAFTTALDIEPANDFALQSRAGLYHRDGNDDAALLDTAAALKLNPKSPEIRLMRANIFRTQGKVDDVLKEAAAMEAESPDSTLAHVAAANVYHALKHDAEAMRAYDAAIAIKPEPYIYINRSDARSRADIAGRRSDIDAAVKLDPTDSSALSAKAKLQVETGDFTGAIATYSGAIVAEPHDASLLVGRGVAYARGGDKTRADKDFVEARAAMPEPAGLNNLCWMKATAGVALESALADCEAALAKQPDQPAYLDSRALVLLRLGRLDEALVDYDKVLAMRATLTSSLFGRGVVWSRKGNKAKSDADIAAALKIDPDVGKTFKDYGVQP